MDQHPPDAVDGLMHILIADDDPVSRVYLRAAVERLGHRWTVEAADAEPYSCSGEVSVHQPGPSSIEAG